MGSDGYDIKEISTVKCTSTSSDSLDPPHDSRYDEYSCINNAKKQQQFRRILLMNDLSAPH